MTSLLIVDDSPSDLDVLTFSLQAARPQWVLQGAASAEAALEAIDASEIDLVVTDLRMPKVDGSRLVAELKQRRPDLPVIVVTTHGCERLAVEALAAGATGYVAKNRHELDLVRTIEQVLERVYTNHSYRSVIGNLDGAEMKFAIKNDPQVVPPLVDLLQQVAYGMNVVDICERRQLGIALEEAILNAMLHGNLQLPTHVLNSSSSPVGALQSAAQFRARADAEPYLHRRVRIRASVNEREARYLIQDDGEGFEVPEEVAIEKTANGEYKGLFLMRAFMDEVNFNPSGNEVLLIKKRSSGSETTVRSSIEVTCPNGHRLRVKSSFAGKTGRCPKCQAQITVPVGEPEHHHPTPTPTRKPVAAARQTPPKPAEDPPATTADAANAMLESGMSLLGGVEAAQRRKCGKCGKILQPFSNSCGHCGTYYQQGR